MSVEQANIFCYVITGMSLKEFSEQMINDLTEKPRINNESSNIDSLTTTITYIK